jgi:hypothetical protein
MQAAHAVPKARVDASIIYICTALLSRAAGSAATRRFVLIGITASHISKFPGLQIIT